MSQLMQVRVGISNFGQLLARVTWLIEPKSMSSDSNDIDSFCYAASFLS